MVVRFKSPAAIVRTLPATSPERGVACIALLLTIPLAVRTEVVPGVWTSALTVSPVSASVLIVAFTVYS